MTSLFNVRDAEQADISFVVNSWLKRFRAAIHPRLISDKEYYKVQHDVIAKILGNSNCRALVACDPEDPQHIYGYIVYEELAPDWLMIHWTYVKGSFRRYGVCKGLLTKIVKPEHTRIQYSHKTQLVNYLNKTQVAVFNPFFCWTLL